MKKIRYHSMAFALCVLSIGCSSSTNKNPGPISDSQIAEPHGLTTSNVHTYMVDPNATNETAALFYNLKKLSKTKFAIGQQDAFNSFYNNVSGMSDFKKTTGNDPALLGSDFSFITDISNNGQPKNWFYQQEIIITDDAKEAYQKGMINTFCWHLREPYHEVAFYTADMTADEKAKAFKSILPGGANHNWFKLKLDKVAQVVSNLKDANGKAIPIIFRPFHEFDGNWFWWGAAYCTAEEYKTAYKFLVTYLRDTKGVHNILYAFSPDNSYATSEDYLNRYPGDNYVDVLGMDNYGDFNNQGQSGAANANAKLKMVSDLAKSKVKIAAMTETGYPVTASTPPIEGWFSDLLYGALATDVEIGYVMLWNNTNNAYCVPVPGTPNVADFRIFAGKPKSVLENTLPDMYHLQ